MLPALLEFRVSKALGRKKTTKTPIHPPSHPAFRFASHFLFFFPFHLDATFPPTRPGGHGGRPQSVGRPSAFTRRQGFWGTRNQARSLRTGLKTNEIKDEENRTQTLLQNKTHKKESQNSQHDRFYKENVLINLKEHKLKSAKGKVR